MRRSGRVAERLVGLFLIGVAGFTPPVLALFSVPTFVAGIPLFFLYLFGLWIVLVALAAIVVSKLPDDGNEGIEVAGDGAAGEGAARAADAR